jgi:hypothetical protein
MPSLPIRTFPLAALAALAIAAPASAAVTVGSNLAHAPNLSVCEKATSCTVWLISLASGSQAAGGVQSSVDGVVVRWRVRSTGAAGDSLRPRVLDETNTTVGIPVTLPNVAAILTYQTRLPIKAGNRFAVDVLGGGMGSPIVYSALGAGESIAQLPAISPGPLASPVASLKNEELLLNADIEPDLDGDGYGDETQDQCPTQKATHGPCAPASPAAGGSGSTPSTTGTGSGPDPTAHGRLTVVAAFTRRVRLSTALRRGLTGALASSEAADVTATAIQVGGASRIRTLARGQALGISAGIPTTLTLRFGRAARRRLRHSHRPKLALRITVVDRAGKTVTLTRHVVLVRGR